jgi:type IV pilus assembly protein PilM
MLKSKSFLCVDFGAGTLKAAEFELTENSSLCLKRFGVRPMGLEGSSESMRAGVLQRALNELIAERGFTAKTLIASVPGYQVFSKYVKLPPVDSSKVTQIIQYEAQQNVPFPLDEVVWDYQITGNTPGGDLEVFLVAVKAEIVEGLFKVADAAGMRLQLVDAAPSALCNAFRYNYSDLEGCSMLLDIGAKTSNVVFFEKNKYSSRGINIGANSITQDFMAEVRMPFAKAEAFKIAEGFVSLGGAYEEPENPQQAQISKIARQVMTRLHIQVNQTMQFFRQQGGGAPQRLFLAGGASIMPYTPQFFQEKLNSPVEYFNPFRTVQIDPSVNLEDLAKVAHSLGEVVGLGLRNVAQCPIELNLMPKSILKKQQFNAKKPYFVATVASLALGLVAMGWFYDAKIVAAKQEKITQLQAKLTPLEDIWNKKLDPVLKNIENQKKRGDQYSEWLENRTLWIQILTELRESLIATEGTLETTMREKEIKAGVWIEKMTPDVPGWQDTPTEAAPTEEAAARPTMSAAMMRRYGLVPTTAEPAADAPTKKAASTNEIGTINLTCAAVNLQKFESTANIKLMEELKRQLRLHTNIFSTETDLGTNNPSVEPSAITFEFPIVLKLKRPIKI